MEPNHHQPHVPGPSLWPVGFAVGIVVLLVGLVISWWVAGIGASTGAGMGVTIAGVTGSTRPRSSRVPVSGRSFGRGKRRISPMVPDVQDGPAHSFMIRHSSPSQ